MTVQILVTEFQFQNMIPSIELLPRRGECVTYGRRNPWKISLPKPRSWWGKMRFSYQAIVNFNNLKKEIGYSITFSFETVEGRATCRLKRCYIIYIITWVIYFLIFFFILFISLLYTHILVIKVMDLPNFLYFIVLIEDLLEKHRRVKEQTSQNILK